MLSRLPFLLASCLAFTGCVITAGPNDPTSTLTVENSSSFDLRELHLTLSTSSGWGPNLLGGAPLRPGDTITLDGISCDTYDVLMVDETGAQCEADGVSLCFSDASWVITNNTCNVFARSSDPTPIEQRVHVGSKAQQ